MPKKFYSKEQVDLLISETKDSIPIIQTGIFSTYKYERDRRHIKSDSSHEGKLTITESFDEEFNVTPKVFFTPESLDIKTGNNSSIRYAFKNLKVDKKGFTVDVVTWENCSIWELKIKWLAIGK